MDTAVLVALVIVIALINGAVLFVVLRRRPAEAPKADDASLKLLLDRMYQLDQTMDRKVGDINSKSERLIRDFQKDLGAMIDKVARVEETGKQMVSFADQLQSLQDVLKNPKQRGVLGEYYLETLLKNVLPPGSYEMQYGFSDGEIVDAIVRVKDKIIPVDSKFSLENYNRIVETRDESERERLEKLFVNDLKLRIQETAKYIRPNEGTMDFAFMFIPHEAIYYDLLVNKIGAIAEDTENLIQRAANKYKVIIVSPTSFLAYLQTVLQGLKALQIEETAKDIVKRVDELGKHLKKYEEYHAKLGASLGTVVNHYNFSYKELKKVDKDVLRITGTAVGLTEAPALEKPDLDE